MSAVQALEQMLSEAGGFGVRPDPEPDSLLAVDSHSRPLGAGAMPVVAAVGCACCSFGRVDDAGFHGRLGGAGRGDRPGIVCRAAAQASSALSGCAAAPGASGQSSSSAFAISTSSRSIASSGFVAAASA